MTDSTTVPALPIDTPPLLLVRLAPIWTDQIESLEPGHERTGHGWYPEIGMDELADSMRAWWRLSTRSAQERGVHYAVAVVDGVTRMVMSIEGWLGPRDDGRVAFRGFPVTEGPLFDLLVGKTGKSVESPAGAANPIRYWPPANGNTIRNSDVDGPTASPMESSHFDLRQQESWDALSQPGPQPPPPPMSEETSTALPPPSTSLTIDTTNASGLPLSGDGSSAAPPTDVSLSLFQSVRLATALKQDLQQLSDVYKERVAALQRAQTVLRAFGSIDWQQRQECVLTTIDGCVLVEPRKGATVRTWSSSSSGRSHTGLRVGPAYFGSSSGSVSSGQSISYPSPDVLQSIDRGQLIITTDRVSFVGSMFSKTITADKVAGYEVNAGRVCFAARNSNKVWIAQFPSSEASFLAASAIVIWNQLFSQLAVKDLVKRAIVGPQIVNWLVTELVGEHPGELWELRRAAHVADRIAQAAQSLRPWVMRAVSRQFAERTNPPRIVLGQLDQCWSCGRPVWLSEEATCACGEDISASPAGHVPYLSELVNRFRLIA